MCGIAGIVSTRQGRPPRQEEVEAMVGCLRHRGPDGSGVYVDETAALGHARLSIIDLAGGAQPLANEDRSVWVTFNGEIFNYIELKRMLRGLGHKFATNSDTEVIVHLYEEYGVDFVAHLNGQFAIGLWDARERCLVLARDRVGIRPLFFSVTGGRVYFASEIKALLVCPGVPRAADPVALTEIFTYWAPLDERTGFAGIRSLQAGHVAIFSADGRERQGRYWDWTFPSRSCSDRRTFAECMSGLDDVLMRSVQYQTRADVPIGAYVSGGLDSAMILAYLRRFHEDSIRTFSLRFSQAEFDEGRYQRDIITRFGTDHTEVVVGPHDIADHFATAVAHAELPILRTAPVPMMLLAAAVRKAGIKVVMTGEGADETFAGYDLFREARVRRFWARQPHSRMRPALLARLYPYLQDSPVAADAYAQRFFGQDLWGHGVPGFGHWPRWQTTRRLINYLSPDLRQAAREDYRGPPVARLPEGHASWAPLSLDQYVEAHTLLSGYLLSSQGDRMALAHGVETRVPFLDHRVVEYANGLPGRYKLMGLREKCILKELGRRMLPASICDRAKQPYRAPDSSSFFHNGKAHPRVADAFDRSNLLEVGYFDVEAVAKLFDKCRRGRAIGFSDNMAFVGIYSTLLWHARFIDGAGVRDAVESEAVQMS
ncbi:MAG: asparagine synthase (glutamine-hydrolyzing) [Gammaproteobacteria bacterium]|nr:asparagine synthase (glutamine-hydrolyzing) [Gammaproteobacteria bacterium]